MPASRFSDSLARIRTIAEGLKGQANPLTLSDALTEGLAAVADALESMANDPEAVFSAGGTDTSGDTTGHD